MIKDWIYAYFAPNIFLSFCILYLVIYILSAIVYKLGFARKLPILKALLVYIMLGFGCIFLTFLGTDLPISESLLLAIIVLAIAKLRMKDAEPLRRDPNFNRSKNEDAEENNH